MQRSILVLALALTVVIFLTALLLVDFQESDNPAAKPASPWRTSGTGARVASPGEALAPQDNPETLKSLGVVAYREGDFAAAAGYLEQYRERRPDQVEAYTLLAISLINMLQLDEARRVVEACVANPRVQGKAPAHFVLACILATQKQPLDATREFRVAYGELGPKLLPFAQSAWASDLRALPAYQELLAADQKANAKPAAAPVAGSPAVSP